MNVIWRGCLCILVLFSKMAWADESIQICYGYGCLIETPIIYTPAHLAQFQNLFSRAKDAQDERENIAQAVGLALRIAGQQSPIYQDLAGNFNDPPSGKMDCIDHSRSTTRILQLFEQQGFLKYHRVYSIQTRYWLFLPVHHSAAIMENANEQVFVVDSWFVDNGQAAIILPLHLWKKGEGPHV